MKYNFILFLIIVPITFLFYSCKDNPTEPAQPVFDWEGEVGKFNEVYRDSILFNSTRSIGTSFVPSVHMMYKDGTGIHYKLNDWNTFAACWSPRKWKIFYLRDSSSGRAEPALYVMNADGSNNKLLIPSTERVWGVRCSPDGKKIAYVVLNDLGQGKLKIANPDGTSPRDLTGFFGASSFHSVSWSSDSKKIIFDGADGGLGVINADGTNQGLLFKYNYQIWDPLWSPDGKMIAFASFANISGNYYGEIFIYDLKTGNIKQLTNKHGFCQRPCWSPDSNKLLFSFRDIGESPDHIFSMALDGTNQQQITNGNDSDWDVSW